VVFAEYGFNFSATRQVAVHRGDADALGRIFWSTIAVKLLLALIGLIVLAAILAGVPRFSAEWSVYLAAFITVFGYVFLPGWYLSGLERMWQVAVMQATATLVTVACIFLFVHHESDYRLAMAIQASNLLLAAAIGMAIIWRAAPVRWHKPDWTSLGVAIKEGWQVFLGTVATSLYTSTNIFVLGMISGSAAVGYFSAAEKVVRAVQGMFSPITRAMYPRVNALAASSRADALRFIARGLRWLLVGTGVAALSLLILADPLMPLLLGERFRDSATLARLMSFLPPLLVLDGAFGVLTLLSFGLRQEYLGVVLRAGLLNLALLLPLTWLFGARGTAVTVLLTEFGIVAGMWLHLRRHGLDPLRGRMRGIASPAGR
jgi:PST family polysaccharide transporter